MSRLHREQIFGSVTTAEHNEKQNETYYNREPVLVYPANNENMFFSKCVSPSKTDKMGLLLQHQESS